MGFGGWVCGYLGGLNIHNMESFSQAMHVHVLGRLVFTCVA